MAPRSRDGNLDGEDNDALDEAGSGATPVKSSLGGRIRSGLQPGADRRGDTGDRPPRPRSSKQIVERLDDRERTLCFAASGLAVLAGILIYLVEHENPHFRLSKGQLTPETTLVIGLAVGVLLLGATLLGRRAPVGFVALFAFLAFGTQYFAGIPFLVLAVWLLVRSYKFLHGQRVVPVEARDPWDPGGGDHDRNKIRSGEVVVERTLSRRGQQALHPQTPCSSSPQTDASRTEDGPGLGVTIRS
jgi:preprotein translocase subunit Sec61beta